MKFIILALFGGVCVGAPIDKASKTGKASAGSALDSLGDRQTELQVIGGQPSHPASWRFVVAIQAEYQGFICAGSLITWDAVLTTAHCVDGVHEAINVKIGIYDREAGDELDEISVIKVVKHEKYDKHHSYLNDIAVLHLEHPTDLRPPLVTRAELPEEGEDYTMHEECYMVGWGRTDLNNTAMSPVLAERHVRLIDHCECQDRWDKSLFRPRVFTNNVCIDDEEGTVSACQGDSGSPVTCLDDGSFLVVGLSSWGSSACHTYPSVYTDTTKFVSWIVEQLTEFEPEPHSDKRNNTAVDMKTEPKGDKDGQKSNIK